MDGVLWVGKAYLVPGSVWFLIVGLGFGLALLFAGSVTWGRRWLTALLLAYVTMSIPAVALALQDTLGRTSQIVTAAETRDATLLVVLGNGVVSVGPPDIAIDLPGVETAMNISETARLYRLLGGRPVICSGGRPIGGVGRRPEGEVIREYLVRLGVAPHHITVESRSINTKEQAERVAAMLPPGARILLVTEPTHLRRATAFFRARGVDVVPATSRSIPNVQLSWGRSLLPSRYALRLSERVVYEYLGLAYYGILGKL